MANSNSNSSRSISRGPFEPATRVEHLPVVFYEILYLAKEAGHAQIEQLIQSVIDISGASPGCLSEMAEANETAALEANA